MRSRTLLLILATAVVVAFALLNWTEFSRPTPLNLGWTQVTAPLGLLLLGLLVLVTIGFLASSAISHARHVKHEREQARALQDQRDLADRAEASRFIDLRKALDDHLRDTREREKTSATERDQALGRAQRDLRGLLDQMHRSLTMYLGEMEARIDARIDAATDQPLVPRRPEIQADAVHETRLSQAPEVSASRNT